MTPAPVVRSTRPLLLAGVSFFGNPFLPAEGAELDQIELLWRRYRKTLAAVPGFHPLPRAAETGYELHVYGRETAATGLIEVFTGQAVAESASIPHELCLKIVAATLYAVLELPAGDAESDWRCRISREWLPETGFEVVGTHDILLSHLLPSGARVPREAWVPIRKRG